VTVPRGPVKVNAGRSFTATQWAFIEDRLREAKPTPAIQRLRVAMHLLYATGLRLSEVVTERVQDLQWVDYPSDAQDDESLEGWVLTVIGKGQKERDVPVPQGVVDELMIYLFDRGIGTPTTLGNGRAYLLGKTGRGPSNGARRQGPKDVLEGIAATTLYDQLKAFFSRCAKELLKDGDQKGGGAAGQGEYALAEAHPCQPRDRGRDADRDRAAKPRTRVAGDNHGLRQDRGKAPDESGEEVLGGEGGAVERAACHRVRKSQCPLRQWTRVGRQHVTRIDQPSQSIG
jgi:hypothetical protein